MHIYATGLKIKYDISTNDTNKLVFRCFGCIAEIRDKNFRVPVPSHVVEVIYQQVGSIYMAYASFKCDFHCCIAKTIDTLSHQIQQQTPRKKQQPLPTLRPLQTPVPSQTAFKPSQCEKCLNAILKKLLTSTSCEENAFYASWTIDRIKKDFICKCPLSTAEFPVSSDAEKPHEYAAVDALITTINEFATRHGFTYSDMSASVVPTTITCADCIGHIKHVEIDRKLQIAMFRRSTRHHGAIRTLQPPVPHSVTFTRKEGVDAVYVSHIQPNHCCRNADGMQSTLAYCEGSIGYQHVQAFANSLGTSIQTALGKRKRFEEADIERLIAIDELLCQVEQ